MKKFGITLVVLLLALSVMAGCEGTKTINNAYIITMDVSTVELDRYEVKTVKATVKNANGEEKVDAAVLWKSDNADVVIVDGGNLSAVGVGTAIVTAYLDSGEKAEVTVSVTDSLSRPVLSLSDDKIELLEGGDSLTVSGEVKYKNTLMADASFSYSIADTAVATVSQSGVVTSAAAGETTLTVKADWRNAPEEYLTKTIPVIIKEDISLNIETDVTTIFTADLSIDEQTFNNSTTINCEALLKGKDIPTSAIRWLSSDSDVASVENGVVTGKKEGNVKIYAQYTSAIEKVYKSNEIDIVVKFPELDRTDITLDLDLSDENLTIDGDAVFGLDANKEIVKITALDSADNLYADNKLNTKNLTLGKNTVIVYNDTYAYKINIILATKIIKTADDLYKLQEYGGVEQVVKQINGNNLTFYKYGGYFILANNIVANDTSKVIAAKCVGYDSYAVDIEGDIGFTGTFDGRGYTIGGFTFGTGGLFGDLSTGAVVKNVGFANSKLADDVASCISRMARGATIENVFADVRNTVSKTTCGLIRASFTGVKITNCVVVSNLEAKGEAGALVSWAAAEIDATNNYVIVAGGTDKAFGKAGVTYAESKVKIIALAEADQTDFTGLGEMWKTDGQLSVNINYEIWVKPGEDIEAGTSINISDYYLFEDNVANINNLPEWAKNQDGIITVDRAGIGQTLTVRIESKYNSSIYKTIEFNIIKPPYERETISTAYEIEIMGMAENLVLDLEIPSSDMTEGLNIKLNGQDVVYTYTNNQIVIAKTALSAGKATVTVTTDSTIYTFDNITVITKIIKTEADLYKLQEYGGVEQVVKQINGTNLTYYKYGGYFVLGNNITASSDAAVIKANTVSYDSQSVPQEGLGFTGTFDGRGYTISGYSFGAGGLFGFLSDGSEVKNISFANSSLVEDAASVLARYASNAKIDNVFAEVKNTVNNTTAALLRAAFGGTNSISNCVIVSNLTEVGQTGAIVSWNPAKITFSNNYAVIAGGTSKAIGTTDITYSDAQIKVVALSDANSSVFTGLGDIWNTTGTVPVFSTYEVYVKTGGDKEAGSDIVVSDYVISHNYLLDTQTLPEWATLTDGIITIDRSAEGQTLTLKIISKLNSSIYNEISFNITQALYLRKTISDIIDLEIGDGTGNVQIPLAIDESDRTNNPTVTIGDTVVESSYSDGNIVIAKSLITQRGKVTFTLTTDSVIYTFTGITVADQILKGKEDLAIFTGHKGAEKIEGYYILGNDIDASGVTVGSDDWGSNYLLNGFRGTLDGRGHGIYNATAAGGGFFWVMGIGGTVRNIAFIDLTFTGKGFSQYMGGSLFENVFISAKVTSASQYMMFDSVKGDNGASAPIFRNVVIYVKGMNNAKSLSFANNISGALFENVMVISETKLTNTATIPSGLVRFATISDYAAGTAAQGSASSFDKTKLDATIWDIGGDIPVIKDIDPVGCYDTLNMKKGNSYNLNDYMDISKVTIDLLGNDDKITLSESTVTVDSETTCSTFDIVLTSIFGEMYNKTITVTLLSNEAEE